MVTPSYTWRLGLHAFDLDADGHDIFGGSGTDLDWFNIGQPGYCALDGTTDDTLAFQAAIDDATSGGAVSRTLYHPGGILQLDGALQDTGAFNGQIVLPSLSMAGPSCTISLVGANRQSFSSGGSAGQSFIRSSLTGGTGTAAVISGGNGSYPGTKNNVSMVVRDISCIAPDDPTMTFWNLAATQAGAIQNLLITTEGAGTGSYVEPTNANSYGIKLPQVRNSNYQYVDGLMVSLFNTGLLQGELAIVRGLILGLCKVGVEFPGPGEHLSCIVDSHMTGCTTRYKATGLHYCDILADDFETTTGPSWSDTVYDLDDASDYLHGSSRYWGYPNPPTHTFTKNGGANFTATVIGDNPTGVAALDDLTDVTITAAAADDTLRFDGSGWINDNRRWEPVTFDPGTGPEIVFDPTDVVMTWKAY